MGRRNEGGSEGESEVRWVPALLVSLASLVLVLGILEGISRHLIPNRYLVWPPGFHKTFDAGYVIHGVTFPSQLTINAAGMRGDLPGDSTAYRILAVGGSTTICVYLDDAWAWPHLLQERLNDAIDAQVVWVGNVGRPGHQTNHHVVQVDELLPQHPEIDAVVLLIGINDLLTYLSRVTYPQRALSPSPHQKLLTSFSFFPGWDEDTPWYERNFVGRFRRLMTWRPMPGTATLRPMDEKGEFLQALRGYRQKAARMRSGLPGLETGLGEYVERVNQIIDIAHREDIRVLLLTQPTLWSGSLSRSERELLWGGGPPVHALRDGANYYSAEALAEGMERYNDALLRVCRTRKVECLDLARQMPRTTAFFYDDAHFTEKGSARLAGLISDYLLEHEPLSGRADP